MDWFVTDVMAAVAGAGRGGCVRLLRLQRYIVALLFLSFLCGMLLGVALVTDTDFPGALFGACRLLLHLAPDATAVFTVAFVPLSCVIHLQ